MPKILIVDDEEDQEQLILQRFAHKEFLSDYQFLFARNGLEALEIINSSGDIEIALVDINMPKMDGLTFLERARTNNSILQAIIISAYGDMSNIRVAMNRGAFDFLTKPINFSDLEATIHKTIELVGRLKEKARIERENLALRQHAVELEMKALRAQMNPHFIFNSLNSINNFILRSEKQQASEYLVKFSKLIRLILENSMSPAISLEKELEALALYIQLESLRFEHSFDHKISYSKDLDTLSIKVPPLILQPFVENAIHHGLLPKDAPGQLEIDIGRSSDLLKITIMDNGIGRQAAATMRARTKHKMQQSLGVAVTSERIRAMTTDDSNVKSKVEILDLVDNFGKASGTEVRINIELVV